MKGFQGICSRCLETSTLPGLPRVLKPDKCLRALWIVGLTSLFFLSGLCTWSFTKEYLSYPKRPHFSVEQIDTNNRFLTTEIVVCNKQVTSRTGLNNATDVPSFSEFTEENGNFIEYLEQYTRNLSDEKATPYLKSLQDFLTSHTSYFWAIRRENASRISTQMDPFIVDCQWVFGVGTITLRQRCRMEKVRMVSNPQFFNCFRIPVFKNMQQEGISLILYRDSPSQEQARPTGVGAFDQYNQVLQSDGVRLGLNQRNTYMDFTSMTFDVQYGQSTNVHVSFKTTKRLGAPYGNCARANSTNWYLNLEKELVLYSAQACRNAQVQATLIELCNCLDPTVEVVSSSKDLSLSFCIEDYSCWVNASSRVFPTLDTSHCLPLCEEDSYDISRTSSKWPQSSQLLGFYKTYVAPEKEKYPPEFDVFENILQQMADNSTDARTVQTIVSNQDLIRDNFAQITLTFPSHVIVTEEEPALDVSQLISSIGGGVSLYSGITFVFVLEILDFFFQLLKCPCPRSSQQKQDSNPQDTYDTAI